MDKERQPLIVELCYLAAKRNEINVRRHRARFRKNYYVHALRVVEAHNNSNYELRQLRSKLEVTVPNNVDGIHECARLQNKISLIERSMRSLIERHPKPTKWQAMGLHKLRSLILQGEGEYALAKHETMEFTIKHRERVKYLTNELQCSLRYDNGSVVGIHFSNGLTGLNGADIQAHADKFILDKAVEEMIQE